MKPNTHSKLSLPFKKDGEISILGSNEEIHENEGPMVKTIIMVRGLLGIPSVNRELEGYLKMIRGVEEAMIAEHVAVFQYVAKGKLRNPLGLLKSVRAKFEQALKDATIDAASAAGDPHYKYLKMCREKEMDQRDLAAELASQRGDDEEIDDEEEPREYCDLCGDPMDECVCGPVCPQCGQPEKECVCVEDEEEDN